jgi:hypothetical protein
MDKQTYKILSRTSTIVKWLAGLSIRETGARLAIDFIYRLFTFA